MVVPQTPPWTSLDDHSNINHHSNIHVSTPRVEGHLWTVGFKNCNVLFAEGHCLGNLGFGVLYVLCMNYTNAATAAAAAAFFLTSSTCASRQAGCDIGGVVILEPKPCILQTCCPGLFLSGDEPCLISSVRHSHCREHYPGPDTPQLIDTQIC